jgi:hypothetical protein
VWPLRCPSPSGGCLLPHQHGRPGPISGGMGKAAGSPSARPFRARPLPLWRGSSCARSVRVRVGERLGGSRAISGLPDEV